MPVVPLTATWLDSVASRRARYNVDQIECIDSLYHSGYFGPPGDIGSRRQASLMARLTLVNAYRDLLHLAGDSLCVYEANEGVLKNYVSRYSDVSLYTVMQLEQVRLGLGRVCMHYNVEKKTSGELQQGGKRMPWRVKDTKIDGEKLRVLSVDIPTGDHEVVEALLAPHHCFKVDYVRSDGPPAPYECFMVYDIEGAWLRKWGMHRPKAYMFYVTPQDVFDGRTHAPVAMAGTHSSPESWAVETTPASTWGCVAETTDVTVPAWPASDASATSQLPQLPATPLVGIRMYIQGLRFRLPLFLPDINLDDLRELELAMPILEMDYLRAGRLPSWLAVDEGLKFADWRGYGDVPPGIRERFPDQ